MLYVSNSSSLEETNSFNDASWEVIAADLWGEGTSSGGCCWDATTHFRRLPRGQGIRERKVGGDGVSSCCLTRLDLTVEPDFGIASIHLQVHVKGEWPDKWWYNYDTKVYRSNMKDTSDTTSHFQADALETLVILVGQCYDSCMHLLRQGLCYETRYGNLAVSSWWNAFGNSISCSNLSAAPCYCNLFFGIIWPKSSNFAWESNADLRAWQTTFGYIWFQLPTSPHRKQFHRKEPWDISWWRWRERELKRKLKERHSFEHVPAVM